MELPPLIGQAHGLRGALQQPHAQAFLQPLNGSADPGLRQPERVRRAGEAAGLDHRDEDVQAGEQAVSKGHGKVARSSSFENGSRDLRRSF
ncbi:MAG: hypothetical protein WDN28_13645 [Chthoniobacter sp.]